MKNIKSLTIGIFVIFIVFLAFYKPEKINIEGEWNVRDIILDNEVFYKYDPNDEFYIPKPKIQINNWSDSLFIIEGKREISASFEIEKNDRNNYNVVLSSKEKSLNGNFNLEIDTIHTGSRSYKVNATLKLNKTLIFFQRQINIGPWKPDFPKRGKV